MVRRQYSYRRKIPKQKIVSWPRRPVKPGQGKRFFILTLRIMVGIGVIALLTVSFHYVGEAIARSPQLALQDIRFEGCNHVSPQKLMDLAQIRRGTNLFALDLGEIAQKITGDPWVKTVKIERNFPHQLTILITERIPVALVHQQKLFLVDRDGDVFKEVEPHDDIDLPIVTGLSSSKTNGPGIRKALAVLDAAEKMGVLTQREISEVNVDENYGITLYTLQEVLPIRLGVNGYQEKLKLLKNIRDDLVQRKITPRAIDIISLGEAHVKVASSS